MFFNNFGSHNFLVIENISSFFTEETPPILIQQICELVFNEPKCLIISISFLF